MRRRLRLLNVFSAATASGLALVTIGGLLSPDFYGGLFGALTGVLLQVVVVVVALALLIGLWNLNGVHLKRVSGGEKGWPYSLALILTMLLVIGLHALGLRTDDDRRVSVVMLEALQISIESALAGLLFFFLVYAAYRMMRERVSLNGCFFTLALLIVLAGAIPLQGLDALADARRWLTEVPVTAGARGLLIGIGLATVTVGLRVIVGQEQTYREE